MKPLTIKIVFIFLLFTSFLNSQNKIEVSCGTSTSSESVTYLNSLKPLMKGFEQDFMGIQYSKKSKSSKSFHQIPIKIHVIRNSDGSGGLDVYDLENAIKNLNTIYSEAFMEFYMYQDINFIDESDYVHFEKGEDENLMKTDYKSGIINIYFTDYIENNSGSSICGYSVNNKNSHMIIMKNGCTPNDSSLAHEMGHVFSLMHTHGISNKEMTSELVDGSNCDTDGDGICDTPADPGLSGSKIDNFCGYNGNETDINGDVFSPDTENIMSYSRKACRNHFTPQQLARMYAYFRAEQNGFIQSEKDMDINEDYSTMDDLNSVSIYPNPVLNGKIYLKNAQGFNEIRFEIINLQGQKLAKGKTSNGVINIEQLSSGSYLLLLANSNSRGIKRFIK